MEQLIIFLLLAIGSAISTYLQKKKQREAEQGKRAATGEPPVPHWPATTKDWQEELRRMLQGDKPQPAKPQPPAPPKIPPAPSRPVKSIPTVLETSEGDVVFQTPLTQSTKAYSRAAQLGERVDRRLRAVDAQTHTHKPTQPIGKLAAPNAALVRRWVRRRESLREAFVASLIFGPPAALQNSER